MVETMVKMLRRATPRHGVLQRSALLEAQVTRRQIEGRLASGTWERVLPGTYRIEGTITSWEQSLHSAVLWAGQGFVISHGTAARLHGLSCFEAREDLHLTVDRHLRSKSVRCHRISIDEKETRAFDGLKVTTMGRTLVDLAGTESIELLDRAIDEALRMKRITLEELERAVTKYAGRRGMKSFRAVVDKFLGTGGPTESELERQVLEVLDDAGVPRPKSQRVVRVGRKFRLDFLYPQQRVVIEADGYAWHSGVKSFEADRHRHNALALAGYVVLRWTWAMLKNERDQLIADLQRCLSAR